MSKKYFSEILLLTKSRHEQELECWLQWHLNIINADHIVLFDNDSTINVKHICNKFGNKIEYISINGFPNQYRCYNEHISNSQAQWCMPIDDDEFFYISDNHKGSINNLIENLSKSYNNNLYYIMWLNMFSKEYMEFHGQQPYLMTHTYYSYAACRGVYPKWRQGNGWGKSLFNTDYKWKYSCMDGRSAGHIPLCLNGENNPITSTGVYVSWENLDEVIKRENKGALLENTDFTLNKDCFLAHYQYKTKQDWKTKCTSRGATHWFIKKNNKINVYDELYRYSDTFKPLTLLKDKYQAYLLGNQI